MTNISLDLSNKTPALLAKIIKLVKNTTDELNIPIFLIGATARDLVLQYGYGIPGGEATQDIDFGLVIGSWSEYDQLKQALVQSGQFQQDVKVEHRMMEVKTQTEIDIVPFGGIESPDGKITWESSEREMNTKGFVEAYDSALKVKLTSDLAIRIVSPVGLVILKIIAWNDRRLNKDTSDFWLVTKNYFDINNNANRIYENHSEWLIDKDFDTRIAGAKLLGIDIAKISSRSTKSAILEILMDRKTKEQFIFEIIRLEKRVEEDFDRVSKIVDSLLEGMVKTA